MTTEQLREKYEQENGIRCITPKGDGDIRYVEFLESEIEKRDEYLEMAYKSLDVAQCEIRAQYNQTKYKSSTALFVIDGTMDLIKKHKKIKEAESGRETAP